MLHVEHNLQGENKPRTSYNCIPLLVNVKMEQNHAEY